MNILIISPGVYPVPPVKGGAVENLIQMLIEDEEVTNRHEIVVYTVYEKGLEKMSQNLDCDFKYIYVNNVLYQIQRIIRHITNLICKKYIGNQYIHKISKEIKDNIDKYDTIIIENQPKYGLILRNMSKNAKLILHLHNDYLNIKTKNAKQIKETYDTIFSISNYINNRVKEINSKECKLKVLYNGIDFNKFDTEKYNKLELRKKYGFKEDDFIFIYSGRLAKEKGVKELIEAFCKVNNNSAKLLIVGRKQKGQERYYEELLKIAKIKKENIIFKGYVEYEKMPELYNIADIGIIPSICNEAFGLSTIECLACGNPVVVSNMGALPEIINNAKCGKIAIYDENYVENLKENMIYFLNLEREKIKNLKKEAVTTAKKYTKEIYIQNFLKLIEEE